MTFKEMCARVLAQICGGFLGYRLNQTVWNLGLTPSHWYQSYNTSYGICLTFLNVSTTQGFLIGKYKTKNCRRLMFLLTFIFLSKNTVEPWLFP